MTNAYDSTRGNVTDRVRRKAWLIETYRADQDLYEYHPLSMPAWMGVTLGMGIPACRCYRCGQLLVPEILIVDRIVPACKGGTYRRNNIRPSCRDCSDLQGRTLSAEIRSSVPMVRSRVPHLAARNTPAGGDGEGTLPVPDVQAPGEGDLRRNGSLEGGA